MTDSEFTSFRSSSKRFTLASMKAWIKASQEPWRLYGARHPDDLPSPKGSPAKLAELTMLALSGADPEITHPTDKEIA